MTITSLKSIQFGYLVPAVRIAKGKVNQWLDKSKSNDVTSRILAEVTENDFITVIRPSKLTNQLSDFKVSQERH